MIEHSILHELWGMYVVDMTRLPLPFPVYHIRSHNLCKRGFEGASDSRERVRAKAAQNSLKPHASNSISRGARQATLPVDAIIHVSN